MRIGVVGAGSWGTTLANLLSMNGHQVTLWAREPEVVRSINADKENRMFLPGCWLHDRLVATDDLAGTVVDAQMVVSAPPSHFVRTLMKNVATVLARPVPVVSVSKGLEPETFHTITDVIAEELDGCPVVALSGPSFAREVYDHMPTAVVAASVDEDACRLAQDAFSTSHFRVYTGDDVKGVQLAGALKNVVAIAAGILEGLGLGHNPRAALITRGLAETSRLGVALGADPRTFSGLAGMGDLILTATGSLSRNRMLGVALGRGKTLDEAMAGKKTVAEGVNTAAVATELGRRTNIELPIANEVSEILFAHKDPRHAIRDLMERELKAEVWQ